MNQEITSKYQEPPKEPAPKRPHSDRGQGRKPKPEEQRMVVVPIRLTPEQKADLQTLGGAKWVRAKLAEVKAASKG